MFIEKASRGMAVFDLNDSDDVKAYNDLLNDPAIKILDKKYGKTESTTQDGEYNSTEKNDMLYVEYEECDL